MFAQVPAFESTQWEKLKYDKSLFVVDQSIAHYLPNCEEWHVGYISNLNYRKQMWATYPKHPRQKGNKMTEYSHAFRESDYGTLWYFLTLSSDILAAWHA